MPDDMIEVPATFRQMPRWWHDERGRAWLDRLPSLVARQCSRWGLEPDGPVLHGSNALVVPVTRSGLRAALRLVPPDDDVAAESTALRHWRGGPVVELLDVEADAGAALLERLDASRSLLTLPVPAAIEVLGGLTRTLAIPAPPGTRATADIAAQEARTFTDRWAALGGPTAQRQRDRAVAAAALLAEQASGSGASVNGDLHFEQVLAGGRHPWTVVDPVLLQGDPEYDLGRVLWSRLDELDDESAVRQAFSTFVAAAQVPADRAGEWVIVRAMSYLLWGLERGLTLDPPRCRRLLDLFG